MGPSLVDQPVEIQSAQSFVFVRNFDLLIYLSGLLGAGVGTERASGGVRSIRTVSSQWRHHFSLAADSAGGLIQDLVWFVFFTQGVQFYS